MIKIPRSIFLPVLLMLPLLRLTAAPEDLAAELKKNVRSYKHTGMVIDRIPQVNQRRNFCAPATVSMVLRYYDSRINQKKLAKLFETDRRSGTMISDMLPEFGRGELAGFELRPLYRMTVKELEKLLKGISAVDKRIARRLKKDSADYDMLTSVRPKLARKHFPAMRKHLIKQMSGILPAFIDRGIPIVWCVEMAFDPEVKSRGGHMRLISGYLRDRDSKRLTGIVYRDSWGSRSQNRTMSFEDAVTMTCELWVILPEALK